MRDSVVIIRNANSFDFGGGERFPVFVGEILKKHGYSPIIITKHKMLSEFARSKHIKVIDGIWLNRQNWSSWRILFLPLYIIWQIVLFFFYTYNFMKIAPVAIHVQSRDDFIAATLAARLQGINVIWTDHADLKHILSNIQVWYKNPIGKLVYLISHLATKITVVSKSELKEVRNNINPASKIIKKITVVYNGCSDVLHDIKPNQANSGEVTFVVASRLVIDKGVGEVISAFLLLNNRHKNTRLVIAGDGPEESYFKDIAANNPSIVFVGHQDNPYPTIVSSSIFVQPTYHEGFSVALVEASMLEMPIIATSVGGNVEIIKDGYTGLLVPARNIDSLHSAMKRLYLDKELRGSLAKAARKQYLQKFVLDNIVMERFVPMYENTN